MQMAGSIAHQLIAGRVDRSANMPWDKGKARMRGAMKKG